MFQPVESQLNPAPQLQLVKNVPQVVVQGMRTHGQLRGDLTIAEPPRNQRDDLRLARSEV